MKKKVYPGVAQVTDEDEVAGSDDRSRFIKKMGGTVLTARRQ